jgi:hypothetical protein
MSENTPEHSADAAHPSTAIADTGTSNSTQSSTSRRQPVRVQAQAPRWIAPVALLLAVVACALAAWALLSKPSETPAGAAAANSEGDPKTGVCDTFKVVTNAVALQTHNDLGPDPIPQAAVAGNARLALFGGGQYLLTSIQPDTPKDLAVSVRSFANNLQAVGMNALAGVTNDNTDQAARLVNAEQDRKKIADLCK